jgi:hypothetical protein
MDPFNSAPMGASPMTPSPISALTNLRGPITTADSAKSGRLKVEATPGKKAKKAILKKVLKKKKK